MRFAPLHTQQFVLPILPDRLTDHQRRDAFGGGVEVGKSLQDREILLSTFKGEHVFEDCDGEPNHAWGGDDSKLPGRAGLLRSSLFLGRFATRFPAYGMCEERRMALAWPGGGNNKKTNRFRFDITLGETQREQYRAVATAEMLLQLRSELW